MATEDSFRFTLLVVAFIQSVASLYYMWRAKAGATIFRRRDEGIPLSVVLGSFYFGYCASVVTYLTEPTWMAWSAVDLPALVRWGGAVIVLFGAILATWSLKSLGRNFAFAVVPKQQHTLVTTGPYRWVRHPLYSTFLVEAMGISLFMSNWFVATMAGFLWALAVFRTWQEEEKLIERYGDEYRQYMNRVGRFFPRLHQSLRG